MTASTLLERFLFPHQAVSAQALRRAVAGRAILITGASFGIGEQLARQLGSAGGRLLLVARTASRLETLAAEITAVGGSASVYPCDLNDLAAVEALAERLPALQPAIVISNAGKSIRRPIVEALDRFHDITRTNNINFLSPARLILAALPGMLERGGQIVSVSAANVLLPPAPYWAAYQASKTAFDQWLRSAAPELRARGVAVTSIYLPLVRTRMIAPTTFYDGVPAMQPDQAAMRIAASLITRRRAWAPWWLSPAHALAPALRTPWEAWADWQQRRGLR